MSFLVFAILMFITNLLGVYFAFTTWYSKKVRDVPVILDKFGHIEIDEKKIKEDAGN